MGIEKPVRVAALTDAEIVAMEKRVHEATQNAANAAREAGDYRVKLRAEEERSARLRKVNVEYATAEVARYLATRLTNPSDFDAHVGYENVLDPDGRVMRRELEVRTDMLLAERPYLARNADRAQPDVGRA